MPYLRRYGQVDVFLSGANSQLKAELPVRYRSKGLTLFYNNGGGLNYVKIISGLQPARVWKEVRELPVEKYDVVLNDFECITSLACAHKKIPSVNIGHQASFQSPCTPRPKKTDAVGEFILKYFARATAYTGLHFEKYDDFIFTPVIKREILRARPEQGNHITVYLSAYGDETLVPWLMRLKPFRFQVFTKKVSSAVIHENITFLPVSNKAFTESMITSAGVITGAGFETPAEALQLQKKLMVVPIRGQYEQLCNAAALERMGVPVVEKINETVVTACKEWMESGVRSKVQYNDNAAQLISQVLDNYPYRGAALDIVYPGVVFN